MEGLVGGCRVLEFRLTTQWKYSVMAVCRDFCFGAVGGTNQLGMVLGSRVMIGIIY
jgi:hypothetical protein